MMSTTKNISLIALGLAAGLGAAWVVKRAAAEMDRLSAWQRVLGNKYGASNAQRMIELVRQRAASLLAAQELPENPALRGHLTDNILPGLALYQVLLQETGQDRAAALAEVDEALRASTLARSRMLLWPLRILPVPFRLFRFMINLSMQSFPAEGWDFEFIEDSPARVAFNGTRCFYLNALTSLGAPELTASFCKSDEVMAELFPRDVHFIRPHTLGRGDALCDFQYCNMKP
jgi:hypothetical protein